MLFTRPANYFFYVDIAVCLVRLFFFGLCNFVQCLFFLPFAFLSILLALTYTHYTTSLPPIIYNFKIKPYNNIDATGNGGFKIVGAHTDSPVLKIKPVSKRTAHGYIQCGVETYGGGLWHTWMDRELSLAGRVIVRKESGGFEAKLVHIKRPLLRVPNLCIHLQSGEERAALKINKETHLEPILSMVAESLNKEGEDEEGDSRHAPELMRILAEELGCKPSDIQDLELSLCDVQEGQCWGANNEFLSSPRLDNQSHCYSSMAALINYGAKKELVDADVDVSVIALFDHEEVGSQSAVGAGSPIMKEAVGQ